MYLTQDFLTPRQLSKVAGQLSAMHLSIDSLFRLFTRNMYHFIENRISWHEPKTVTKTLKKYLKILV